MRKRSLFIFLLFLSIALILSGCNEKSYFFDFSIEPDLARSDGTWTTQSSNYEIVPSSGLALKGIWAAAPHFYNGDFEVRYEFEIKTNDSYRRQINLLLSSGVDFNWADWWGGLCVADIGYNPGDFRLYFWDTGSLYPIGLPGPVEDVLVYPGENIAVLKKRGDVVAVTLNGTALNYERTITGYNLDWFCPVICTYYEAMAPWDIVIYKSLEVVYKGEHELTN